MKTNPAEILQLVRPDGPALPAHPSRVGLTETERRAVTALVAEDGCGDVLAHVVSRATALAGPDGPAVRRRSISKAVAGLETQLAQLNLLLAEAVVRRDADAVALIDRAATGITKRLCSLLQEHRFDETRGVRSVVVGMANHVTIEGRP